MNTHDPLEPFGLRFPDLLIPGKEIDLHRWSVIACDQHTSNPAFWEQTRSIVGESPSTLDLILPEVYIGAGDPGPAIAAIQKNAQRFRDTGVFRTLPNTAVYVKRTLSNGTTRKGLVVAVDLEAYDFDPEAKAAIRASEQTIPERLPLRARIRDGAAVESPHVIVLLDDASESVIEGIEALLADDALLYETPLMQDGGSIRGYAVPAESPAADHIARSLEAVKKASPSGFIFATGDGNHSLAGAKTVWEQRKGAGAAMDDPYRFCLVEVINVYDAGLPFFAIHRLVNAPAVEDVLHLLIRNIDGRFQGFPRDSLVNLLATESLAANEIAVVTPTQAGVIRMSSAAELAVSTLERILSDAQKDGQSLQIDYIHGADETLRLAETASACAVLLPNPDRGALFPTVASRGALPRKAFSLGEAQDKRYYLECRSLLPE